MCIFSRDFAKMSIINIGNIPLLPTEAIIFVWAFYKITDIFVKKNTNGYYFFDIKYLLYITFIIMVFTLSKFTLWNVREFVTFSYIIIIFVSYDFFNSLDDFIIIKSIFYYSLVVIIIMTLVNNIGSFRVMEAGNYTYKGNHNTVFLAFALSLISIIEKKQRLFDYIVFSLSIIWILFFALHRSTIIAIVISTLVFMSSFERKRIMKPLLFSLAFLLLFNFIANMGGFGNDIEAIGKRVSTIRDYEEDYNANWRMEFWQEAINYSTSDLKVFFVGNGLGITDVEKKFAFREEYSGNILEGYSASFHNSYVYLFSRIGILGLMLFLLIIAKPLLISYNNKNIFYLKSFGLALLTILIFSAFNVVFENSYLGFFIWFYSGGIFAYINKVNIC